MKNKRILITIAYSFILTIPLITTTAMENQTNHKKYQYLIRNIDKVTDNKNLLPNHFINNSIPTDRYVNKDYTHKNNILTNYNIANFQPITNNAIPLDNKNSTKLDSYSKQKYNNPNDNLLYKNIETNTHNIKKKDTSIFNEIYDTIDTSNTDNSNNQSTNINQNVSDLSIIEERENVTEKDDNDTNKKINNFKYNNFFNQYQNNSNKNKEKYNSKILPDYPGPTDKDTLKNISPIYLTPIEKQFKNQSKRPLIILKIDNEKLKFNPIRKEDVLKRYISINNKKLKFNPIRKENTIKKYISNEQIPPFTHILIAELKQEICENDKYNKILEKYKKRRLNKPLLKNTVLKNINKYEKEDNIIQYNNDLIQYNEISGYNDYKKIDSKTYTKDTGENVTICKDKENQIKNNKKNNKKQGFYHYKKISSWKKLENNEEVEYYIDQNKKLHTVINNEDQYTDSDGIIHTIDKDGIESYITRELILHTIDPYGIDTFTDNNYITHKINLNTHDHIIINKNDQMFILGLSEEQHQIPKKEGQFLHKCGKGYNDYVRFGAKTTINKYTKKNVITYYDKFKRKHMIINGIDYYQEKNKIKHKIEKGYDYFRDKNNILHSIDPLGIETYARNGKIYKIYRDAGLHFELDYRAMKYNLIKTEKPNPISQE